MNQSPSHNFGTPSDNWASGHSKPKKDASVWIMGMVIGAVIFAAGCGSGIIVGWIGGMANNFGDVLSDYDFDAKIAIEVAYPESITLGETMDVVITITDSSGVARTIEEIDFAGTLRDNAEFVSIQPTPSNIVEYPDFVEHYFSQTLGANQSADFVFKITPDQVGIYKANITVYMEDFNNQSSAIEIQVVQE